MQKLIAGVAALALAGVATQAFAAQASQTVTATAHVVQPITITKDFDLGFGKLVMDASNTAGTVVVDPTGSRSDTGGVDLVGTGYQVAQVTVAAESGSAYTLTIDSGATLNRVGGGASMTVSSIGTDTTGLGTLDGNKIIKIGGTLNAAAGQAAGDYTGTFNVTAAYN